MITQLLLIVATLTTGVIYGTDVFHAIVVKKAATHSKDASIADLMGHTHLIADQRMPVFGIAALFSTATGAILNIDNLLIACLLGSALLLLLSHLYLYMAIAKPVNKIMTAGVVNNVVPTDIRALQNRWDSIINYRAAFLTMAMILLSIAVISL